MKAINIFFYFLIWLLVQPILSITQTLQSQRGQISLSVQELFLTKWDSPEGILYMQVPGANLGATSFEIMDNNRIAFLCNSNDEIVIVNRVNGKAIRKFSTFFAPRDLTYSNEYFFVLTETQVIQYDELGNVISNFSFPEEYIGVERLTRFNNATYLLLPNGNSLMIESNGREVVSQETEGWITSTGDYVLTRLKDDYSYSVKIIKKDYNNYEKTFETNKKVAGVFVIGSTNNRVVLDVQTFISEIPISVERNIVVINSDNDGLGAIITSQKAPDTYYVLTNKDFSLSNDGTIFEMVTAQQGVSVFALNESTVQTSQSFPLSIQQVNYHFNDHLMNIDNDVENIDDENGMNIPNEVQITRDQIISNAIPYTTLTWTATSSNIQSTCATISGKYYKTPKWVTVGSNTSVPYKWDGFTNVNVFANLATQGKKAGNYSTTSVNSPCPQPPYESDSDTYIIGVDCSGFVSRAWGVSSKYGTWTLPSISTEINPSQLQPGDIVNKEGSHTRLFMTYNQNGSALVIEASGSDWKTTKRTINTINLTGYTAMKYNNVTGGGNPPGTFTLTLTPECYNENTSQITLNWTASSGADSYDIYRNEILYASGINRLKYENRGNIVVGTTYTYYVHAKNSYGSTNSNTQSATALNCASCTITSIKPSSETHGASSFSTTSGVDDIIINTQANCSFIVTESCSWLTITPMSGKANSVGQAFLNYSIEANTETSTRQYTFYVNDSPVTIIQNGCSYDFYPTTKNVSASGSTYNLDINTGSPCQWTIQNNCSWVHPSQLTGTGDQTITVTVDPNTSYESRTCTFSISPGYATHIISQQSTTTPTITVTTNSLSDFGDIVVGQNSSSKSYTVKASDLTNNLTIEAANGFEISQSSSSDFTNSLIFSHSSGTVSTKTIYVRFKPTNVGHFSGNIVHKSNGAAEKDVAVSGTGVSAESAPTITSTPITNAVVGQLYSYDVDATGNPTPTYTLTNKPSGMLISQTSGMIEWTPSSTGNFDVTVKASNGVNPDDTQIFTIKVQAPNTAPKIISTPVTNAVVGQLYTYDVDATGNPAPTYSLLPNPPNGMSINESSGLIQWTPSSVGNFNVTVSATNGVNPEASQPFTINVIVKQTLPDIIIQPVSQSVNEGETVSFKVEAECDGPMEFQWWASGSNQWNNGDKSGRLTVVNTSKSSTLTITNVNYSKDNNNEFTCEAKNMNGYPAQGYWKNSNTVNLTVKEKIVSPNITLQPASQTVNEGETVSFKVEAECDGPMEFQWWASGSNQWNNGDKSGRLTVVNTSKSSTLTITNVNYSKDNNNEFTCEVKNMDGYPSQGYWINSNTAYLTVKEKILSPIISLHPATQIVNEGETANFLVTATCANPIGYQWWRDPFISVEQSKIENIAGKIEGAQTSQLKILNTTLVDNNTRYLCEVYNSLDHSNLWVNSNSAILSVIQLPKLIIAAGTIDYNFGSFEYGNNLNPNSYSFELQNNGGGTLNGSITLTGSWLNIDSDGFNLISNQTKIFNIYANTNSLEIGNYIDTISIQSNGGYLNGEISCNLITGIEDLSKNDELPKNYYLENNYPNPFNPSTIISFGLPEQSTVSLVVYDVTGIEVAIFLKNERLSAGSYQYSFDSRKLASGIYFYQLTCGSYIATKKMIMLK